MALRRSCRCRPRSSAWLLLVTKRGFRWQGPPSPLTWRHRCPPCVPVGDWSGRLQAIFDAVPDGARVADLGCGHGRVAFALAASGEPHRMHALAFRLPPACLMQASRLVGPHTTSALPQARLPGPSQSTAAPTPLLRQGHTPRHAAVERASHGTCVRGTG